MKRSRIRPVSSKTAKRNREWSKIRKAILERDEETCQYPGCWDPATDVHHKAGRVGKAFSDPELLVSLCSECHRWTHSHPVEARGLGLMVRRVS